MIADEVLEALQARGAVVFAEGRQVRIKAPAGAIPPELTALARKYKQGLLTLVVKEDPPPGARLFLANAAGLPCAVEDCFMWTWEGAALWHYAEKRPVPPVELVLWERSKVRCSRCVNRSLRLSWQTFADQTKHLACHCGVCSAFVKYLRPPPGNVDVEYRTPRQAA